MTVKTKNNRSHSAGKSVKAVAKKKEDKILDSMQRIKPGMCPNFFVCGDSFTAVEQLGMKITDIIRRKRLIRFKGVNEYFTVIMPYFDSKEGAAGFQKHIERSISIARSCYDSFCGVVLVELAEEWAVRGANRYMDIFLGFLAQNEQICFAVLVKKENDRQADKLFGVFSEYSLWFRAEAERPEASAYARYFRELAESSGYSVDKDAEGLLTERLESRSENFVSNEKFVEQMIKQIVFDREMSRSNERIICAGDLGYINTEEEETAPIRRIGFKAS